MGALCALWLQERRPLPDNRLAAAGLAMVLTLLPVAGTALLILFAQDGSRVARALSWPGLAGIGLISYSAYLWHQPVFALARLRALDGMPGPLVMAGLAGLVPLLAWATWRFVETPFRRRVAPTGRALAGWGLASGGYRGLWEQANPERTATLALIETVRASRGKAVEDGACRFSAASVEAAPLDRLRRCQAQHGPGLLVIGDSHAQDFLAGLAATDQGGVFVLGLTQGGCRPDRPSAECGHDRVLQMLAQNPGLFRTIASIRRPAILCCACPAGGGGGRSCATFPCRAESTPPPTGPAPARSRRSSPI